VVRGGFRRMANASRKPKPAEPAPPGGIVCEPGRHVGCLHAAMAAKRAAAKGGSQPR
jgi:hypothetical protein